MQRTILLLGIGVLGMLLTPGVQAACPCEQHPCAQPSCEEVQYEAHQVTEYTVVYEDVVEKKLVPSTKFVPVVEYRDVPCAVCQALPESCAPAAAPCGPCQATPCCRQPGLRKVPVTVLKEVPCEKEVELKHVVEKRIPHTYTCYVPKPCPCAAAGCGK